MSVMRTLASIGRLLRQTPPPPADILEAYAHEVVPVLDRAEWLYQYWLEQSTLFSDSEKLGNVAAIHRWETATMGRSLERVIPPPVLASAHESVLDALDMASRAAQLLSSGSRFHNANAVCEGQSLLTTSRERRIVALRAMRRYLASAFDAADAAAAAELRGAAPPAASQVSPTAPSETTAPLDEHAPGPPGDDTTAVQSVAPPPSESPDLPAAAEHAPGAYAVDDDVLDDEEDALPWLTRLAEQRAEAESESEATAPDQLQPVPEPPPASPASPRPGWGSLFGRRDDREGD